MGIILFERETCDLKARLEEYLYKFKDEKEKKDSYPWTL